MKTPGARYFGGEFLIKFDIFMSYSSVDCLIFVELGPLCFQKESWSISSKLSNLSVYNDYS